MPEFTFCWEISGDLRRRTAAIRSLKPVNYPRLKHLGL